jgi:hypothetical protein
VTFRYVLTRRNRDLTAFDRDEVDPKDSDVVSLSIYMPYPGIALRNAEEKAD